jgi:hypothetical protein
MQRVLICSHSRITGRSHARRAAVRWVPYICRSNAVLFTLSGNIPEGRERAFVREREDSFAGQSHRRVCDRWMATFPRGATAEQMAVVIRTFIDKLSALRVPEAPDGPLRPPAFPWLAAVHALGRDADNPHCHIILLDEDVASRIDEQPHTGKTAIGLSEMGSTERLRAAWADAVNATFGDAGGMVSPRSYKRLAKDARVAGDVELAAYYEACDAVKAVHIGPAAAAAVRAKREVTAAHLRESAERYRQGYFARAANRAAARPVTDDGGVDVMPQQSVRPTTPTANARGIPAPAAKGGEPQPLVSLNKPVAARLPETSLDRLVRLHREGKLVIQPPAPDKPKVKSYEEQAREAKERRARDNEWARERERD